MIEFWDLEGEAGCRYSTFSWRTRLALLHKKLDFVTHPVKVSDKQAIAFSGQPKVPIIKHDNRIVTDSWAIAVYLERTFPDQPSLFGGDSGEALAEFFNLWVDREVIPTIIPYLMRDVLDCVDAEDAVYHRGQMEKIFKRPLEDLYAEREKNIILFRKKLQLLRKVLATHRYLGGSQPSYADYTLFGVVQWARVVSEFSIFEAGDVMEDWFQRVLDLYEEEGRKELSRHQRMKVA